jgi:hypothetical protein
MYRLVSIQVPLLLDKWTLQRMVIQFLPLDHLGIHLLPALLRISPSPLLRYRQVWYLLRHPLLDNSRSIRITSTFELLLLEILVEDHLVQSTPTLLNSSIDHSLQLQTSLQQQNMLRLFDMVKGERLPHGDLVVITSKVLLELKRPIPTEDIIRHPSS